MTDLLTIKTAVEAAFTGVDIEDRILILAELTSEAHVSLSIKAMTEVMKQSVEALLPTESPTPSLDES
jgi:hypothetical protein